MLKVARILKSNGVEGAVLVSSPDFDLLEITGPVFIDFDGLPVPFFLEDSSPRGIGKYIIKLNDVCSLSDAQEMVGRDIMIDAEDIEDLEESFDYIGWKVYDSGSFLGEVSGVEPIPGNMCLYVKGFEGEVMVPLHEDFIESANPQEQILYLKLPKGLY